VIEVFQTAAAVQRVCEDAHWRFCFIGGLALQRWGEPRFTKDADITLFTGFDQEDNFVGHLLQHFQPRIPDAREFALKNRVLLLQSSSGVGIDIALGGLPFEEGMVRRSSIFRFPGEIMLRTCSAEDLIVTKTFAGRGQDWVDVERILVRQSGHLDWDYVEQQLPPLLELKGEPQVITRLRQLKIEGER
jgi:hypothetical protein